jgi:probable rRNA maturation factor
MIKVNISGTIPPLFKTNKKAISDLTREAVVNFDLTGDVEIEIMFVDKEEIKELNNKYRKINRSTDVLSFPLNQFSKQKVNLLGSIVICSEVVVEKNESISDVVKHGLLHLLGYDHEENEVKWESAAQLINCNL